MRIYLSGKITGQSITISKAVFWSAEVKLKQQGHEVINPMELDHSHRGDWISYMIVDIEALIRKAEAIYMIDGWGESRGARIEYAIAKELGIPILFESCNAAISKAEVKP
ncbi:DUF4406 domain-containing protein [Mucilaginibacter gynuensis]|uniref:DUF4406 domain-containing protein n=1 Tax=Mucilaginibacter gynuensis TaxID=1302236 RepID=UPI0031E6A09F